MARRLKLTPERRPRRTAHEWSGQIVAAENARPGFGCIRNVRERGKSSTRKGFHSLSGAQGKEILRALDGILEAAKELPEVGVALDEIDLRSIDDQQVR
jgi:hypothetical protein